MVTKEEIKEYWNTHLPQRGYSISKKGTIRYYSEQRRKRYKEIYSFVPEIAEFGKWEDKKVLEVGIGAGTDIMEYALNGADVYGIDLTQNAVEETQHRFKTYGLDGTFYKMDAEDMFFKDGIFDLVYSFGVLHHTPDTAKAIDECYRVLKKDGKIIMLLYARGWKHYLIRVLAAKFIKNKDRNTEMWGCPLTYIYTKKEIESMMIKFRNVTIERYRLGTYFDYQQEFYGIKLFPRWFSKLCYAFKLEKILGESWIIKGYK